MGKITVCKKKLLRQEWYVMFFWFWQENNIGRRELDFQTNEFNQTKSNQNIISKIFMFSQLNVFVFLFNLFRELGACTVTLDISLCIYNAVCTAENCKHCRDASR